jgi:hypothetical protein
MGDVTVYEDTPDALLQLMNDLDKAGFSADFTLHDGLELRIKKVRTPLIADFSRVRKMF